MCFLRHCAPQFVPHIVVTMPPKLARSWPCSLCAEVMAKTVVNHWHKWSHNVFFAAMLHSLFVHIVVKCPKTGSVLAMQFCVQKS